ncbi:MAG: HAMP domain-containing sensor histidine kinase [Bacteroidota bacterium]|nr:HAMP domain-containing sensor histidine kinase [Bacteroidota bacterium]
MQIRKKLTIRFTAIFALILLIILALCYTLAFRYARNEFYLRLEERAYIAAQIFLEEDELSRHLYKSVQEKYSQTLPDEIIQIYDLNDKNTFIKKNSSFNLPVNFLLKVRNNKTVYHKGGQRQYVGIYYIDNQGNFVIIASAIDKLGIAKLHNLLMIMICSYLFSIILIYFWGRYYSKQALAPITKIVRQVRNISASNLHLRIDEGNGKDEIAELAKTFNNMLQRLESSFEMQKTFVSNASHELRTPLTAILGEIEVLLYKERDKEEYLKALNSVLYEVQQLRDLVNSLLSISQEKAVNSGSLVEEIRLDEFIWEIINEISKRENKPDIKLEFINMPEDDKKLTIHGNRQLLNSAFANILDNAIKFSNNKKISCIFNCNENDINVSIIDQGIGISANDMEKIFQPFFRAGNVMGYSGHGVGLTLAERIFKLYGGKISIKSELAIGTTVKITFPLLG